MKIYKKEGKTKNREKIKTTKRILWYYPIEIPRENLLPKLEQFHLRLNQKIQITINFANIVPEEQSLKKISLNKDELIDII